MSKNILIIVGPTASGKSDLAVKLAKKLNGEIISADSRQVYKRLNIGTGKITKREMGGVKHYLLDVVEPQRQFSASDFVSQASQAKKLIEAKGSLPIIVGGTGFYIDALLGNASIPNVPQNPKLRAKLNKLSAEKLFTLLKKKDLRRSKSIDPHNKVRLIRALEIVEALGRVPSPKPRRGARGEEYVWVGLKPKDLESRIHQRLLRRVPGILRETKKLSKKRALELGLEYRYASLYLQKKLSRTEFLEQLETAIRQYAKRQMTWFKRNPEIAWFSNSQTAYATTLKQMAGAKLPRSRR